jgi:DNA-binding response OmpR family regulator
VVTFRFHDPGETAEGQRLGRLNGVWIDEAAREAWVDGRKVEPRLSAAQFNLLALLYHSAGQMVMRQQIVAALWPEVAPAGVSGEAVDGLIKRLRARLRETQLKQEYIEVLRGHGVRLVQPDG